MINKALSLIKEANAVAIFTGLGMSFDSGLIPFRGDYRLWTKTIRIEDIHLILYEAGILQ